MAYNLRMSHTNSTKSSVFVAVLFSALFLNASQAASPENCDEVSSIIIDYQNANVLGKNRKEAGLDINKSGIFLKLDKHLVTKKETQGDNTTFSVFDRDRYVSGKEVGKSYGANPLNDVPRSIVVSVNKKGFPVYFEHGIIRKTGAGLRPESRVRFNFNSECYLSSVTMNDAYLLKGDTSCSVTATAAQCADLLKTKSPSSLGDMSVHCPGGDTNWSVHTFLRLDVHEQERKNNFKPVGKLRDSGGMFWMAKNMQTLCQKFPLLGVDPFSKDNIEGGGTGGNRPAGVGKAD